MVLISQALLLASTLALANAQTINKDGKQLATAETVQPPGEQVNAASGSEDFVLTDASLANLTALELSDISLFQFADGPGADKRSTSESCRAFPGDARWPSKLKWKVLDLLTGGALVKTVPLGAVCYKNNEHYDAAKCQEILDNWTESATHAKDPTSVMSPLYQGESCMPQNGNTSTCELGGFPSYSVKAKNVAQIQLAINFARSLNLRLVVHNTGHDFLGKSTGAGALSIWTHNFKKVKFFKNYITPSYRGAALKLGAGIQVADLYEAADKYGVTGVGGECKGVGVTGGYIAGGGHSPMTSKYGLASDQVLSIDIVTPNGRFITVDEKHHPDLFWAIRGGGGGTFGVVTSMTVKVYPKSSFSGVTFTITSGNGTANTDDVFWSAVETYWRKFPTYAAKNAYGYSSLFPNPEGGYMWSMLPWLVPGMKLADFKAMVSPLFKEWTELGLQFKPEYFEHDNFYETWTSHFPTETVANTNLRTASRLFPKKNWEDEATLQKTIDAIRGIVEEGSAFIGYNMNGAAPEGTPASAANPAWREAVMFGIIGSSWAPDASPEEVVDANMKITHDWMERLRKLTPTSGGYLNEGDVMEPNFGQSYYGSNYKRLLSIKKAIDPSDLFWGPTAVGSENWYITGQEEWLTKQTGLFEARLEQANLLKRVVEAIKDLVQDCNFDCNDSGIALQAMDNSHVALVSMILKAEGFSPFRCDKNIALGINLVSLMKVLRAAQDGDVLTLKAEDTPDVVSLVFESVTKDRLSDYEIKLMDIDQEHLAIPETEYAATVAMPSTEFKRICADLGQLSESILIEASKEGVRFSCQGEIGNGSVALRQNTNVDKPEHSVSIDLSEPVALTFSTKYLLNFCKATALSSQVRLCLSNEVPLLVEYGLEGAGHLRFFLAPKIGDED